MVFFTTFSAESEPGTQEHLPAFEEALKKLDKNRDGKLSKDELDDPRAKARFEEYLDLDHSGFLEERDWNQLRERRLGESTLRAYRLGGTGDITDANFMWKNPKSLPNVPSPLYYRGVLYTLKEGGVLTSYNPKTGEILKQARIPGAVGGYSASPTGADGKLYTLSEDGQAAVLKAEGKWELIRVNEFDTGMKASAAVAGGKLYIRTYNALYCFAKAK